MQSEILTSKFQVKINFMVKYHIMEEGHYKYVCLAVSLLSQVIDICISMIRDEGENLKWVLLPRINVIVYMICM